MCISNSRDVVLTISHAAGGGIRPAHTEGTATAPGVPSTGSDAAGNADAKKRNHLADVIFLLACRELGIGLPPGPFDCHASPRSERLRDLLCDTLAKYLCADVPNQDRWPLYSLIPDLTAAVVGTVNRRASLRHADQVDKVYTWVESDVDGGRRLELVELNETVASSLQGPEPRPPRKPGRGLAVAMSGPESDAPTELQRTEDLRRMINVLPNEQRRVASMLGNGMKQTDIARTLGRSCSWVTKVKGKIEAAWRDRGDVGTDVRTARAA